MTKPNLYVCVPTYCEPDQALEFLNSFEHVNYDPIKIFVVNANPGDPTSELISRQQQVSRFSITEVQAKPSEFWSATVNRGFRRILEEATPNDWILLTNIDIKFDYDLPNMLIHKAKQHGFCQIGALATSNGLAISSGVRVKSWLATINQHPFSGYQVNDVPADLLVSVDYLPTRCLIFPVAGLIKSGLIAENLLPHYAADYEFSYRLAKSGVTPYILTSAHVELDISNTGESSYARTHSLLKRLSNLMSVKNPSNPWYRIIFVFLVYPLYALPTATFLYLARTVLETFISGETIRRIFSNKEHGFSK